MVGSKLEANGKDACALQLPDACQLPPWQDHYLCMASLWIYYSAEPDARQLPPWQNHYLCMASLRHRYLISMT